MNITGDTTSPTENRSRTLRQGIHWLSRRLYRSNVSQINIRLPEKEVIIIGVPSMQLRTPTVKVVNPLQLMKTSHRGILGWAEAYIAGHWTTSDLRQVVAWAMHNETALERAFAASWLSRKFNRLKHLLKNNSKRGSKKNIAAHYDLGNHFYQQWLDNSMTYSSGLFLSPEDTLEQAQQNKYQYLLDWLELNNHSSVLEIGCGWGGFARALTARGNHPYRGITLSREQLEYARKSTDHDQLDFEFCDYRDLDGQYDRIVSIEMFEAVGEAHWPEYFNTLYRHLKPGGIAALQVITIADERFAAYRKEADFIQRYIFPGGMLPSHSVIQEQIYQAGLQLEQSKAFGKDYARTLQIWQDNFHHAWETIASDHFDQKFYRMWSFYLAYCEAGFKHDSVDVRFYKIRKPE